MDKTVLIAEDDPSIREPLRTYLEKQGIDVIVARDGEEAIATLKQTKPALVLLDLLMPKVDGLGVLKYLRTKYADIPVIISTNLSKGFDPREWAALGATDLVIKSETSLKEMADKIRKYLSA